MRDARRGLWCLPAGLLETGIQSLPLARHHRLHPPRLQVSQVTRSRSQGPGVREENNWSTTAKFNKVYSTLFYSAVIPLENVDRFRCGQRAPIGSALWLGHRNSVHQ